MFAYIATLPQPQRGIAERIDALAAKTLPDLQRAVKWGWPTTVSRGLVLRIRRLRRPCETDVHTRHGAQARTAGDADRNGQIHPGVELASVDDFDERQLGSWIEQAATMPFVGERRNDSPWRAFRI